MSIPDISGVVLAGGRGRRLGGMDKGLRLLANRPLVEYVLEALGGQVRELLINANRNVERYGRYGYQVIPDHPPGFEGPLAGMAAALEAAAHPWVLCAPCDCPRPPPDLAIRMQRRLHAEQARICTAWDGTRVHPVFALLDRELLPSLQAYLAAGGRKIDTWFAEHPLAREDFSDHPGAFRNLNTPGELLIMERELCAGTAAVS